MSITICHSGSKSDLKDVIKKIREERKKKKLATKTNGVC